MAKFCGKDYLVQFETVTPGTYATLGGLQANSLSLNNETVDVTTKGASRWRELLDGCGLRSMSISGNGFLLKPSGTGADPATKTAHQRAMDGAKHKVKIISAAGDSYTGDFVVTSFERSGENGGAEAFTLSLESAGDITYTDAT